MSDPPQPPDPPDDDPLDELVADCLSRVEREGEPAVEAFLAEHPAEAGELRARIEALRDTGLLGPLAPSARDFPERLGDFRLIEPVGGGGMGLVYRAEQLSLGREVALKLVRPGELYFPGARERFRREVETVARLHHPGIVPVYTVGEEQGNPYFAMELVRGCTLGDALEELRGRDPAELTGADLDRAIAARSGDDSAQELAPVYRGPWATVCVRMVREVAEALEHAHRLGVLHRDLKPSNVMVTRGGRVMLLDFGLSSAEGADRLTRSGALLGSLPYMPPERLEGHARADVVTADVYSLGVTLYELLALGLPFRGGNATALQRAILVGEAPPLRRANPAASWELETVCATAVERDPARRYASAGDLARDLTNVLEHRPIAARRAGLGLRARRWVQRHPARAVAAVLAPIALIGTPTAIAVQQVRSAGELAKVNAELKQSNEDLEGANAALREANAALESERELTLISLDRSLEAVDQMLITVGAESLRDVPQLTQVRRAVLEKARALYDELAEAELARHGSERLGFDLAWRSRNARSVLAQVYRRLDQPEAARDTYREVVATDRQLFAQRPHDGEVLRGYVEGLRMLAQVEEDLGGAAEARALYDEALGVLDGLGDDESTLMKEKPVRPSIAYQIGKLAFGSGDAAGALEGFHRSAEACEAYLAEHPDDPTWEDLYATALNGVGGTHLEQGEYAQAVPALEQALAVTEGLLDRTTDLIGLKTDLVNVRNNLAMALQFSGRPEEAEELYRAAIEVQDDLGRSFPSAAAFANGRVDLRSALAGLLADPLGRYDEAQALLEEALRLAEERLTAQPGVPEHVSSVGGVLQHMAVVAAGRGDRDGALALFDEARSYLERALAAAPGHLTYERMLRELDLGAARAQLAGGAWREAAADLERTLTRGEADWAFLRSVTGALCACAPLAAQDAELDPGERTARSDALLARALEVLHLAFERGYRDLPDLRGAESLAPLRERPEYAELERELVEAVGQ